ncbi:MAG: CotH kinase family protein, partial [Planctomycetota bacterium]
MKKNTLFTKTMLLAVMALATLIGASQAQTTVTPENMFDLNTIHSLYIVMDPIDYEAMRFSAGDNNGEPAGSVYPTEIAPGEFEHTYWQAYLADNPTMTDYIDVAIRRKSDLALAYGEPNEVDPQKFSLKVDISRPKSGLTPPNQRFGGKKKLSLECGSNYQHIKEGLTWNIYGAAGIISGRSNWIKVYMSTDFGANFSYMGLYNNVEQVDEEYLEDHIPGRHDYGFLYKKTEYNGDYQQTRECDDPDLPPLPDACINPFAFNWYPFDHATYMTETVPPPGDWLTQTPSRVDENQLLGMAVCENFTANSDALVNKGNNYYYYDWANHPTDPNIMDPAYKEPRLYIPWDLDTSAGSGTDTMSVLDDQGLGGNLFQSMIKQQDESGTPYGYDTYRNQYMAKYADIINGPLAKANVLAMIDAIETAITPALMDEIHGELVPEMTTEGAAAAIANDFNTNRSYYSTRWDSVSAELATLAPLAGIEVLSDGFEGTPWDENWDASPHSWIQASDEFIDGAYSAKLSSQTASTFTTDPLDAVGASAVNVRFWIMKDDTDVTEDIELQYYNGSTYNTIADLDLLGADDEWLVYTERITDSQYFVSDFQVRIVGSAERNEAVWLDKVEISKEVPIPDVVGMDETIAESTLVAANYVLGTKTYVCDASAAGTVLSQNPAAGTSAPLGTSVDLTVSSGPPSAPDVTGMDEASAIAAINAVANISYGSSTPVCDASPIGT